MKSKKIYLAGPMRGIPEYNFPAFDEAAARGRAMGFEIVSPAELDRAHGFDAKGEDGKVNAMGHNSTVDLNFMRGAAWRDFLAIVGPAPDKAGVDAVALLPGWEKSRGANGELALAKWIGLEILDARSFEPYVFDPPAMPEYVTITSDFGDVELANQPAPVRVLLTPPPGEPVRYGEYTVVDSGARKTFETGAVRDATGGKGYFHCLPFLAIERLAKLYEAGAKKYAKDNWKKGIPLSNYIDSTFRHLFKLAEGWLDEDHAAAVMWNAACFMWTANEIGLGLLPASLNDINYPIHGHN